MSLPERWRVLLVEDDQMVRETLCLMMEDHYEVAHAVSVSHALAQLDMATFDIIVLDCLLPQGNVGAVLIEADRRSIPVVLISGDPNQAQAVDGSRLFLSKPFTQNTLLLILDSARG